MTGCLDQECIACQKKKRQEIGYTMEIFDFDHLRNNVWLLRITKTLNDQIIVLISLKLFKTC